MEVAQRQVGIVGVARVNVRDGVLVEEDLDGGAESRHLAVPSEGRHGSAKGHPEGDDKPEHEDSRQKDERGGPASRATGRAGRHGSVAFRLAGWKTVRVALGVGVDMLRTPGDATAG
jgi:hypothetical protein